MGVERRLSSMSGVNRTENLLLPLAFPKHPWDAQYPKLFPHTPPMLTAKKAPQHLFFLLRETKSTLWS
jgi:hypothetical protein